MEVFEDHIKLILIFNKREKTFENSNVRYEQYVIPKFSCNER